MLVTLRCLILGMRYSFQATSPGGLDTPRDPQPDEGACPGSPRSHSRGWDLVGGLSGFFCNLCPTGFWRHLEGDLSGMPPAPPPCTTQWPAQTDPLEKFVISVQGGLKHLGFWTRVSTSTQPLQEIPGGHKGLATETRKASKTLRETSILFPESWSPAGRSRAPESLHRLAALPPLKILQKQ